MGIYLKIMKYIIPGRSNSTKYLYFQYWSIVLIKGFFLADELGLKYKVFFNHTTPK